MYAVNLHSVGNPDFGQYAPVSEPQRVTARTLAAIAKRCREYIEFWDMGGGNWTSPPVYKNGEYIGYVSYNGKVWAKRPAEWTISEKPIYTPRGA